ncbi:amidase signature enzyme [Pholiota conissans]|uniref:Amidase signature enzyme n=1 Tax=Pholiota conissans TaxID=109636 RepID=A0A9P6CTJ9_9AGAR|nr:amidase signature enzyme [Pholiota conissans]
MLFSFSPSAHQRACAWKQQERQSKIDALPAVYCAPLSLSEEKIHTLSISQLVAQCRSGNISPSAIMLAYAKKTLIAQEKTNCLTDIMFEESLLIPPVANWGPGVDLDAGANESVNRERSLLGVPISIKDTVDIKGHDTTIGYSKYVGHPASSSSAIVRLLQDAGALVLSKTTVPAGLLALETFSDVFGPTNNPYNPAFSVGASTGGGTALLACGGSKIEIGTDIAGSVRIPAHFCGIWGLKASAGRFPSWGTRSPLPGLEAIPIVASPMAGNLADLREFWKRVVACEPWQYDHTCVPLPWRNVDIHDEGRKLKWGIVWEDSTVPPSPACKRALSMVVAALKKQGHEVVDFHPPSAWEGLKIGYQLLFSDGGHQLKSHLTAGEKLNAAVRALLSMLSLPKLFKRVLAFLSRTSDPAGAELLDIMTTKSTLEVRELVAQRDAYRAAWLDRWVGEGLDFVLTVPMALPALEHGKSEKTGLVCAGYTFLFSVLDYPAGVLPITKVDRALDSLPASFFSPSPLSNSSQPPQPTYDGLSPVAKAVYSVYDADKMHGLPLGVQVIGRRLEEEKVLEGMQVVEDAVREMFGGFDGGV